MRALNPWTPRGLAFLLLVTAVLWAIPLLIHEPYYLSLVVTTAIALLLTLSLNLMNGTSGQFSLAAAAFFGIGAYVPALLALRLGISPWLGLPCALAAGALIAIGIGFPVLRLRGYFLATATLAFALFVEIFMRQSTELTGGAYGLQGIPPLEVLGHRLRGGAYVPVAATAVVLAVVMLRNLGASALGRAITAARDDAVAAAATGINVVQVRVAAFAISSGIAALAGWVHAFYFLNLNPQMFSTELTFVWLFMVLIGGLGHMPGVIASTILLTVAPELLGIATTQQVLALGIVMLVFVLFAPRGLGGLIDAAMLRLRTAVP
jgi:branched-chain amino acid transport system permease protein